MARILRQSTSVDVPIGAFVDQTDGFTPETTLTITQPDIRLKKNGGAWAQKNAAQTLTHEENGNYEVTLDATDTNTLGLLRLHVNESGALPVTEDFWVVTQNYWDSLFASDLQQVDVTQWLGTAPLALSSQMVQAVAQSIGASGIGNTAFSTDTGLRNIHSGTCAGVANGSITLAGGASSVNDFYKNDRIYLTNGTGVGQSRRCTAYNGTTKVATIEPDWVTNPVAFTTEYTIREDGITPAIVTGGINRASLAAETGLQSIRSNTAQGGSSTSITLDAGASATSAFYAGLWILITGGTGAGQVRMCNGYNGTSKVATVYPNWVTDPDSTSTFALLTSSAVNAVTTIGDGAIAASSFAAGAINVAVMAADMDSYTTRSWIGREGATADKYIVQWFKNGQLVSSGITVPLISVFDDTGTDLIAETAMTEIGSRQCFKFIETTNTLTAGEVYIMEVKATINGLTRIDRQPITRDSV